MNRKTRIIYSILYEMEYGTITPKAADYGIEHSEFLKIVGECADKGFIPSDAIIRGGRGNSALIPYLENREPTRGGLMFLKSHPDLSDTYPGLDFVQDWLSE